MQDKVYILVAGVNGAGKSTFYKIPDENGPLFPFCDSDTFRSLPNVNSDNIVREIGGHWSNMNDQEKAGKIAVSRIRDFLEKGISFSQETTLTGHFILKRIDTAKAKGYKVGIIYVGVDNVDIAKERVRFRVNHGGHDIPEHKIEERFRSSFNNLNKVMERCDGVLLYDNSDRNCFRIVAEYDGKKLRAIGDDNRFPSWIDKYIAIPLDKNTKEQSTLESPLLSSPNNTYIL